MTWLGKRWICVFTLTVILQTGCFTPSRVSNQNLASLYWPESKMLHPDFIVYHLSDTLTRLYSAIVAEELLYSKENEGEDFIARFTISYNLYPSFESKVVLDSGTISFTDTATDRKDRIIRQYFDVKAQTSNTYLIEVNIMDEKRRHSAKAFVNIDKSNHSNRQYFRVISSAKGMPLFKNHIRPGDEVIIQSSDTSLRQLHISFFQRDFPLAYPPFSVQGNAHFDHRPDSAFTLEMHASGAIFTSNKRGFYHLRADTGYTYGLSLFVFHEDYPRITNAAQMVEALRYITTKKEYEDLVMQENKKAGLDRFWLNIAGNPERGRQVIRAYYRRVQDANLFFTSYKEGWKTDRGMIYIVFGPPDIAYRSSNSESWIYGEEGNLMSLNFNFIKVDNPYTDNDFILNRSPIYKNNWYMAVDAWRQGIIY